jgi:hypothetical protein
VIGVFAIVATSDVSQQIARPTKDQQHETIEQRTHRRDLSVHVDGLFSTVLDGGNEHLITHEILEQHNKTVGDYQVVSINQSINQSIKRATTTTTTQSGAT